jgi:cyanophycinase
MILAGCGENLPFNRAGCQVPLASAMPGRYGPTMIRPIAWLVLSISAPLAAMPLPPELVLAGGALKLCSSLSLRDCRDDVVMPPGREASQYSLADVLRDAALDEVLWPRRSASFLQSLQRRLDVLAEVQGAAALDRRSLVDALDAPCDGCEGPLWSILDDHERATLLSALELPQLDRDERRREQVSLVGSRDGGGLAVIEAFVASAARHGAKRPRIAVVSASALDSFEPVDFYLEVFGQAGAEPIWWPVDAALASVVFDAERDCSRLDQARRRELGMSGRERVYPDLALQQQAWCKRADAARFPDDIDGVFFTGGDQWRLRRAFFSADDTPNPWLVSLRDAFEAGRVAIGGTSAGTAVQSGPGMLSNGSARQALREPPVELPPPLPGCERAGHCNGIDPDRMTLWPGGGLGLAMPFLLDTHFSERAREWRLLRALATLPSQPAIGVDETSAIRIRRLGTGEHELEAIGARGGWLLEPSARACGQLSGSAHYLAPGVIWRLHAHDGLQPVGAVPAAAERAEQGPATDHTLLDPLAPGAIRQRAWRFAADPAAPQMTISAEGARLHLRPGPDVRAWTSVDGIRGIVGIDFRFEFADPGCAPK